MLSGCHLKTTFTNTPRPPFRFQGDVYRLFKISRTAIYDENLTLSKEPFYIPRTDITPADIVKRITDPNNSGPFMITGEPSSGKTVMALKVEEELKQAGHEVIFYSNSPHRALRSIDVVEIRQKLEERPPDTPLFVFIDEPMYIYEFEPPIEKNWQNLRKGKIKFRDLFKTHKTPIVLLRELAEEYPNLRIVGVMLERGFYWPTFKQENSREKPSKLGEQELKALFPKHNHIPLKSLGELDSGTLIPMVNKALAYCGFEPLTDEAVNKLKEKLPVNFRTITFNLAYAISRDTKRKNDLKRIEPIQKKDWEYAWSMMMKETK